MRNKKKFIVDGKAYWIHELTIDDIFALYYTFESIDIETVEGLFSNIFESLPLLQSITTCPWALLVDLGASELKNIYGLFLELNNNVFKNRSEEEEERKKSEKETNPKDFIENVFFLYCDLIEAGHTNALQYGYSFFLKAINNHEKIRCIKLANLAMAERMAYNSDNKAWKKYIRGLVGNK